MVVVVVVVLVAIWVLLVVVLVVLELVGLVQVVIALVVVSGNSSGSCFAVVGVVMDVGLAGESLVVRGVVVLVVVVLGKGTVVLVGVLEHVQKVVL